MRTTSSTRTATAATTGQAGRRRKTSVAVVAGACCPHRPPPSTYSITPGPHRIVPRRSAERRTPGLGPAPLGSVTAARHAASAVSRLQSRTWHWQATRRRRPSVCGDLHGLSSVRAGPRRVKYGRPRLRVLVLYPYSFERRRSTVARDSWLGAREWGERRTGTSDG